MVVKMKRRMINKADLSVLVDQLDMGGKKEGSRLIYRCLAWSRTVAFKLRHILQLIKELFKISNIGLPLPGVLIKQVWDGDSGNSIL